MIYKTGVKVVILEPGDQLNLVHPLLYQADLVLGAQGQVYKSIYTARTSDWPDVAAPPSPVSRNSAAEEQREQEQREQEQRERQQLKALLEKYPDAQPGIHDAEYHSEWGDALVLTSPCKYAPRLARQRTRRRIRPSSSADSTVSSLAQLPQLEGDS